jgi:hypothetical protein
MKSRLYGISRKFRSKRKEIFLKLFEINPTTQILDLGGEGGAHIHHVLSGTRAVPANVYTADIELAANHATEDYGYTPVVIPESGKLPFGDLYFDIVFCSSVIEHVTIPKQELYRLTSDQEFKRRSFTHQTDFSDEIRRIGKGYFVQTPNRWFPFETHTWLPFVHYFPRPILLRLLRVSNKIWIQNTDPDWNLLDERQMQLLFPNAAIVKEKFLGLTKSLIAVKQVAAGSPEV